MNYVQLMNKVCSFEYTITVDNCCRRWKSTFVSGFKYHQQLTAIDSESLALLLLFAVDSFGC